MAGEEEAITSAGELFDSFMQGRCLFFSWPSSVHLFEKRDRKR